MPERPHNDPPTDRIVPDPTARIPVGDAARTSRCPNVDLERSLALQTEDGLAV